MNRRRFIIALTCTYSLLQLALVIYWMSLSTAGENPVSIPMGIAINIALVAVNVGMARHILRSLRRMRATIANDTARRLGHYLEAYRSEAVANEQLIREVALDIDEQLAQAGKALESGDSSEVSRRLRTGLDLASTIRTQSCGHVAVAAVLEAKARQCSEADVRLNTQVTLPDDLPLPEIEVASIFFNLIDNALHECEALPAAEAIGTPEVQVYACVQAEQLFVQVTNPCRPHSDARRAASQARSPKSQHGWGTGVVTDIAGRHGGIADFSESEGAFTAAVMIPLLAA